MTFKSRNFLVHLALVVGLCVSVTLLAQQEGRRGQGGGPPGGGQGGGQGRPQQGDSPRVRPQPPNTPPPVAPAAVPAVPAPPPGATPGVPGATPPTRVENIRTRGVNSLFGPLKTPDSLPPNATVLGGLNLESLETKRSDSSNIGFAMKDIQERGTIVPTVPIKVHRYAQHLFSQYDKKGNGFIEKEDWSAIPGSPQAMDLNGDDKITLEEFLFYLAMYGENRTIHQPNPVPRLRAPTAVTSSQYQIFRPATASQVVAPDQSTENGTQERDITELDDDALAPMDDAMYEELIAAQQGKGTNRIYHTDPASLRGVPKWFLERDKDGDGQISIREFAPTLNPTSLKLFEKIDKNGDGFISPDEARQYQSAPH